MLAIVLSLAASLCWGLADYLGGLQSRRHQVLVVVGTSQAAGLVGVLFGVLVRGDGPPPPHDLWPASVAGLLGLAALGLFYYALAVGTISIVAPIAATGAAVPVLAGIATGGRPTVLQGLGLLAALVGVVLAAREPGVHPPDAVARRAVPMALATALLLGLVLVALHASRGSDVFWVLTAQRSTACLALAALCLWRRPRLAVSALPVLVLVGVLDTAANGLFVSAASAGLLAVVAVLSSLYPVVTVGLAQVRLGERLGRGQGVGVALALLGVMVLSGAAVA